MSKILSRNAIKIVSFIVLFLSFEVAFCGNDTIPSSPQTAEEWFERSEDAYIDENYDEAINCCEEAIKLDTDYTRAYYRLGRCYAKGRQDYNKAIDCFKKVIEL